MAEFRELNPDLIRYCLGPGVRSRILRKLRGRNLLCRTGGCQSGKPASISISLLSDLEKQAWYKTRAGTV